MVRDGCTRPSDRPGRSGSRTCGTRSGKRRACEGEEAKTLALRSPVSTSRTTSGDIWLRQVSGLTSAPARITDGLPRHTNRFVTAFRRVRAAAGPPCRATTAAVVNQPSARPTRQPGPRHRPPPTGRGRVIKSSVCSLVIARQSESYVMSSPARSRSARQSGGTPDHRAPASSVRSGRGAPVTPAW